MPSLPRIRRSRARGGSPVVSPAPIVHELTANGLTWVDVVSPDVETARELAERFGWHPLDVEDIVSKRQRPKVDDYEDDGYLFTVLRWTKSTGIDLARWPGIVAFMARMHERPAVKAALEAEAQK